MGEVVAVKQRNAQGPLEPLRDVMQSPVLPLQEKSGAGECDSTAHANQASGPSSRGDTHARRCLTRLLYENGERAIRGMYLSAYSSGSQLPHLTERSEQGLFWSTRVASLAWMLCTGEGCAGQTTAQDLRLMGKRHGNLVRRDLTIARAPASVCGCGFARPLRTCSPAWVAHYRVRSLARLVMQDTYVEYACIPTSRLCDTILRRA